MEKKVKVRIAPSPTGYLHVGNARTAVVNYLFARKMGGSFLLRIDDTDAERSRKDYEDAILEDFRWLGLQWDELARQSDRFPRYAEATERLKASGRLYACYETPEELEIHRKQLAARNLPPVYNRTTRKAVPEEGRTPHWRFALEPRDSLWDDLVRGPTRINAATMSDPVLIRADGVPVYTLASVVDDGELGITHVIRGEDHVSNTAVQVQLFEALGFSVPIFAHLALLKTKEGELSKRVGGSDIRGLREAGILPMAVVSYLARLGTSDPVEPFADMQPIIESFAWKSFGRAPANYDAGELQKLGEKLLHHLPYDAVREALPGVDENLWLSLRGNIAQLSDIALWQEILRAPRACEMSQDDRAFARNAAQHLPPEPWGADAYDQWMAALKPTTDRKGKALFLPLRLALTGMDHGPELKTLLPLLGRAETVKRLTDSIDI